MQTYYLVVFLLSVILSGVYMLIWRKHFDVHITLVYCLVPVVNLGYLMLSLAENTSAALDATRLIYLGGCFLQMFIMLTIFSLCGIPLPRWIRMIVMGLSTAVFLSSASIGYLKIFYKSAEMQVVDGQRVMMKDYAFMHSVFYAMVILYFVVSIGVIVYSLIRKNQVSRKILLMLFLPEVISIISFFVTRPVFSGSAAEMFMPASYVVAQIFYLLISFRISLYNISDTAAEAMLQSGSSCFVTFDTGLRYLGSNDTAKKVLPELNNLTVDLGLDRSRAMDTLLRPWLETFRDTPGDKEANRHFYEKDERIYLFSVRELRARGRLKGYELVGEDDTLDRAHINLLTRFKEQLEQQVDQKTAHIVAMHNNLIMSMATMVESRDNSTGGHIRRTSEGVRILIGSILETGAFALEEPFCKNLIKAAPMHDLGKIAVPDSILQKPGRFTPEEFDIMKTHAAEGARIVHEILKDTDDDAFHILAENVAHFHHERWDGSGYPNGLKGEAIPLEARIMAVADVYDALVSKRVYKDKMSFEKADSIIREGMGSQFDPGLEEVYLNARPKLEAYYASLE
jgi:putative two-component system response regulator